MFNNKEIDKIWDALADVADIMNTMAQIIHHQGKKIHELEHYIDDISVEVTTLEEAVFEDDDEACNC